MKNLVKVSYLNFHVSLGYSYEFGFECAGNVMKNSFREFYAAKRECDLNKETCGCIDLPKCGDAKPKFFTMHSGFKIVANDRDCAWVRI